MPIYEFQCQACGQEAELLVPTTDWKGTPCPSRGSQRLTKKLSVFAVSNASTSSATDQPPCSGNPGACGRCAFQ